jgi:hypothetical protein
VPGIKQVTIQMPNSEDVDIIMKAEGINMREMWKYLHIVNEKKSGAMTLIK